MDRFYSIDTLIDILQKHKETECYVGRFWLDYLLDHMPTVNRKEAQEMSLKEHDKELKRHFNIFLRLCMGLNDEMETVNKVNAEIKFAKFMDSLKPKD